MLGRSHTISGLAAASICLTLNPQPVPTIIATTALVAGAAIAPDLDHSGATISRSLPPLTKVVSHGVNIISGGHRKGTHSVVGWLILGVLAYFASLWHVTIPEIDSAVLTIHETTLNMGAGLLIGFMAGIALTALHLDPGGVPGWFVAAGMAIMGFLVAMNPLIIAVCMAGGAAVHSVAGDMLTTEGVPLLYPFITTNLRVPILGDTGSTREKAYVISLTAVAVAFPVIYYIGWPMLMSHLG